MRRSFAEFLALLRSFAHAMIVTHDGRRERELRSRPMSIADCTRDGHLWFITSVDSELITEITENPQVNVCLQDGMRFLAMAGTARATRDPDRLDELWSEDQRIWFEKGRDDPELILLEIVPTSAEYWDRSGVEGIKFVLDEIAALVSGETLTDSGGRHGKIDFDGSRGVRAQD